MKRANMAAYVEWLVTPSSERDPSTKQAFAELLGVTTQTLRNYEKEPWTVNALQTRRKRAFQVAKVDDVVATLVATATDVDNPRSVSAAKLLLDWMEKQTGEMNADAMRDLSDAELKQMLIEMFDKLDA